jgi:hypothetical protein
MPEANGMDITATVADSIPAQSIGSRGEDMQQQQQQQQRRHVLGMYLLSAGTVLHACNEIQVAKYQLQSENRPSFHETSQARAQLAYTLQT